MELAADPGLTLTMLSAGRGSASDERLRLLGSWAATHSATAETSISPSTR